MDLYGPTDGWAKIAYENLGFYVRDREDTQGKAARTSRSRFRFLLIMQR